MKHLISTLVLVSACTASVDDGAMNGDDGDNDGDGPVVNGTAKANFKSTAVRDERQDRIEFASGEPVHVHGGPEVMLGSKDCPDVYKYSYLMETPKFGREMTANPVRFAVTGHDYRIRMNDDVLVDWTPVIDDAVTISRNTVKDREAQFFVDVRDGDATATACWNHHPLAAPVETQPAQLDPMGLASMKLTTDSPISNLFALIQIPVLEQRYVHHTAEAITLDVAVTAPAATYSRRAVDDFVVSRTGPAGVICEDANGNGNSDPICTLPNVMPDPPDNTAAGALANVAWSLRVIDEVTNAPASNCTVTGLHATCALAPRAITGASHAYRIVLSMRDARELAPSTGGASGEHTIAGLTFTGRMLETETRCAQFKSITKFGQTILICETLVEYTHIQALDRAQIDFGATPILVNGMPYNAAPFLWDAGDDDLPGPQ